MGGREGETGVGRRGEDEDEKGECEREEERTRQDT